MKTAVAAPALPPRPLRVIELEQTVADLMGYVTLHNDTQPIVRAARAAVEAAGTDNWPVNCDRLRQALAQYDELYPEHSR
jgi:hypothetical protein